MNLLLDPIDRWILQSFTIQTHRVGLSTYARAYAWRGHYVYIHRIVMRPIGDQVVDHINGDGLDNRRANLRLCSRGENNAHKTHMRSDNTTGYPGVHRTGSRWFARVTVRGRIIHLGSFDTFEEARASRVAGERQHFGAFAPALEGVSA